MTLKRKCPRCAHKYEPSFYNLKDGWAYCSECRRIQLNEGADPANWDEVTNTIRDLSRKR